jgi:hypothetical protein
VDHFAHPDVPASGIARIKQSFCRVSLATDTGLTTGTTHHFRLFALSTGGDSAADGPIVATTS